MLRWYVNTTDWKPSPDEFDLFLQLLTENDQAAVQRFVQHADKKRALVSRLLQRACVRKVCGCSDAEVRILRTKGRKPFTTNIKPPDAPNFNFNVSHEGDFTALASEPYCVCGIDVAAPQQLRKSPGTPLKPVLDAVRGQFAASEWAVIQSCAHDEVLLESCFQRIWSLKEAFIKARGDGLGFEPLSRAAFRFECGNIWGRFPSVEVDGIRKDRWQFEVQSLSGRHWVSVARGPPEDIVDAHGVFTQTFGSFTLTDMKDHLDAPSPPFSELQMSELLPPEEVAAHIALMRHELLGY